VTSITLRVARPVSNLALSRDMYSQGLRLNILGSFEGHQGFNGVMLGGVGLAWHLEFTECIEHPIIPRPTPEDLLVMYQPVQEKWQQICQQMAASGFKQVTSFNPYWEQQGHTYEDHDGYRTVIQCQQWP
jgi:hypothetical protein